jgi:hypothetical protein
MTDIPITFDILETNAELEQLFIQEIAKELNRKIPGRMKSIGQRMRDATVSFIQSTSTYASLVGGTLAFELGIPKGNRKDRIDAVAHAVARNMEIEFIPITTGGKQFRNGIRFRLLMRDLSEVLSLQEAIIFTEKGQQLDWLRWLLTLGDSIIIDEYDVFYSPGRGRSGGAIMLPSNATAWRVPPQYSGTIGDNWLTRALVDNYPAYRSIIETILIDEFQRI